jgi:cholesterol transport system auxiliary component
MMIARFRSRSSRSAIRLSLACLAGILALGACGHVPRTRYFTLSTPAPAPGVDSKTPFVLDVPRFQAAEGLRDDRILYFPAPTELNYYRYHRWVAQPADLMAELVADRLRGTGAFAEVRLFPREKPGDYILRGRLSHLEELDDQPGGRVRVGVALELIRSRDQKTVWKDRRVVVGEIPDKGVEGVVAALNASAGRLLDQMLPGLVTQAERDSREISPPSH